MLRIFLVFIFLSGCMIPTYVTKHGIKVYDKTINLTPTKTEVEEVTQCIIDKIGGDKKVYGTKVMLINRWIQVPAYEDPNKFQLADGFTNIRNKETIVSVFQTCFADSSMVHELAHIIHDSETKFPDWQHSDIKFWTMIKEMEKRIVKDLCQKDYVHKKIPENYTPDNR